MGGTISGQPYKKVSYEQANEPVAAFPHGCCPQVSTLTSLNDGSIN